MGNNVNPAWKHLPDGRLELRSQIRFNMAPESAPLAEQYRASGHAQVLADTDFEHTISFPSKIDEALWVVAIVHVGDTRRALFEAHEMAVTGFYESFMGTHPFVEIVASNALEESPERDKWVEIAT